MGSSSMNLFSGWPPSASMAGKSTSLQNGNSGSRVFEIADAPLPSADGSQGSAPAPFLTKTYDMVDDPATDDVVSWSSSGKSFVVWNHTEFSKDLLPKYFKHNNFSSFVRQLNTYGFRKVDPEKWEFANEEGFRQGKRELLNNIHRRKSSHGHSQPNHGHGPAGACVEVGKFGLEQEIERLKRDKNVLMMELVRVRQQKQQTERELQLMVQRYQVREQRQQKMISFFARAIENPSFFAQLVKQNEELSPRKKRRFSTSEENESELSEPESSTGFEMVRYQPNAKATVKASAGAMLTKILSSASSVPKIDTLNLMVENFEQREAARTQDSEGSPQSGISLTETTDGKLTNASVDSSLTLPPAISSPKTQSKPPPLALKNLDSGGLMNTELSLATREGPANLSSKSKSPERIRTSEDGFYSATTNISPSGANDLFWEQFLSASPGSHNSETKVGGRRSYS